MVEKLPAIAAHLETARADVLVSTSIVRLVSAVLAEQPDEWTEGRRYHALDFFTRSQST